MVKFINEIFVIGLKFSYLVSTYIEKEKFFDSRKVYNSSNKTEIKDY